MVNEFDWNSTEKEQSAANAANGSSLNLLDLYETSGRGRTGDQGFVGNGTPYPYPNQTDLTPTGAPIGMSPYTYQDGNIYK